jgi:DNA helicase HerA-like ATPase
MADFTIKAGHPGNGAGGVKAPARAVGKVLGTERSSPFEWWVAIDKDEYLQMGDVVRVETHVPGLGVPLRISGVVNNLHSAHEGSRFESDVFLVAEGVLPVQLARRAQILTTRVEPEFWIPPRPGDEVHRATEEARDEALYFDQMDLKLPGGLTRDGEPYFIDYDFLRGIRGGHGLVWGISGVATKTSYASFLLYSLFASKSVLSGAERANTKAVIFNVKGEDLLFLDKPNAKLKPEEREKYQKLGLPVGPFPSVSFYAPIRRGLGDKAAPLPEVSSRKDGIEPYFWTVRDIVRQQLLRFMFSESNDATSQIADLALRVEDALEKECIDHPNDPNVVQVPGDNGKMHTIGSFKDLCEHIREQVELPGNTVWTGGAAAGTVAAFVRRLNSASFHLGHLFRGAGAPTTGTGNQIDWKKRQVTVIDINKLHDRAKRFVVGVVLSQLFQEKENSGNSSPQVYIVLDELNKYAPREGFSPIKELLLDIAERGRSLGTILLGCGQTASEVEKRIVANASIKVVGRLDAAEATRVEFAFLGDVARHRAILLKPGTMMIGQPHIPTVVEITFPFPCWATRGDEVAQTSPATTAAVAPIVPSDPFDGF